MSRSTSETAPLHREEERKSQTFCLANITIIARTFGLITVAVMWVAAVLLINESYAGYYLIAASILVTLFEITWVLDKMACCVREGCCCRCWSIIMWVDNWKKFVLYLMLSVPLFLEGMRMVFGIVTGFCMVLLAVLYLVKTFRTHVAVRYEKTEKRVVSGSSTSGWQVVRHESSTQTDFNDQAILSTTSTITQSHSSIP